MRWRALGLGLGLLGLAGCGARPNASPAASIDEQVTLYRDRALVQQRIEISVPPSGTATVPIRVAAGVGPDDVVVL
ncbi:MAG TPA: hypothetical protein VLM79_12765, partial [Kofleriaceae bacterium]|nr:hypothetical protein [Kofleriaceae bacterium]